jgi:phosphatidylserine/phosphatidylglycerophosphate/cardiolipin synthase-like enzyme
VGLSRIRTAPAAATLLCVAAVTAGCATPSPPAAPHTATPIASGSFRLIQEPDDGYRAVDELIGSAHTSLDMTMYELTDPAAVEALIDDRRRGATVRVLLDRDFHGRRTNQNAYNKLSAAGVAVKWAPTDVIVHQKTFVVDGTVATIGTGNLTSRYYATSRDAWIVDSAPPQVAAIEATFTADFAAADSNRLGTTTQDPGLVWSPGAEQALTAAIESARRSVEFSSEELADPGIIDALSADARRGVSCRIVMTDSASWTTGFAQVSHAGCQVHVYAPGAAVYMHEKQILTDATNLTIGSQNASTSSLTRNRELSAQLTAATAPDVVVAVSATFDRDFAAATPWSRPE